MNQKVKCAKCSYYNPIEPPIGECRRYPPMFVPARKDEPNRLDVDNQALQGKWPLVRSLQWCGEARHGEVRP